jgi:hypothetical protein
MMGPVVVSGGECQSPLTTHHSQKGHRMSHLLRSRRAVALLGVLALAGLAGATPPQESPVSARVAKVDGALLSLRSPTEGWKALAPGSYIDPRAMVVALPGAELKSRTGTVMVKMLADLGKRGPFPVFESAVRIHEEGKYDLDFTLDRGIAAVVNIKEKGAASVHVRLHGKEFDLTLLEPGTVVGLEVFGRHPPGTPTVHADKSGKVVSQDRPTLDLVTLVIKGKAVFNINNVAYLVHEPPGPAGIQWDNVSDRVSVRDLTKLPPTILPTGPDEEKMYKELCGKAARLGNEPIDKVLAEFRSSKDPRERRASAVVNAALDKLPAVLDALEDKHADLRDETVTILRNWIGRQPGQVEKLYETLVKDRKYTPVQARGFVHLLYGATESERKDPATYELLIGLLDHSKVALREMARWHLVRLAPAGRDIAFDAAAPPEQRQQAVAQWRALIPEGKLPPKKK